MFSQCEKLSDVAGIKNILTLSQIFISININILMKIGPA